MEELDGRNSLALEPETSTAVAELATDHILAVGFAENGRPPWPGAG